MYELELVLVFDIPLLLVGRSLFLAPAQSSASPACPFASPVRLFASPVRPFASPVRPFASRRYSSTSVLSRAAPTCS